MLDLPQTLVHGCSDSSVLHHSTTHDYTPCNQSSTVVMPSNGRDRFTIGWISPLPLEAEAAKAALDEYYGRVDGEDGCYYITGRMGQHDVVIGIQTQIGAAQAASLAQRMATSFRNIELFLVVGIAGGVPHYESGGEREEMVLGDVVICVPGGGHSGVYAYDQGAWKNEGELVQRGVTNKPAPRLLDAVNLLRTGFDRTRISEALTSIRNKIEPDDRSKFQDHSSDGERDRIFHSNYAHLNEMQSCKECKCDLKHSSSRSARGEKAVRVMDRPKVHYGCIGSANQLQMSAKKRDELRDSWMRVIAFEMEYVGVIDNHPCITIRGISDYADGHKDKSWQAYAAATAAACAKIVLEAVPPSRRASEGWKATREDAPPLYRRSQRF
jgi:nucleoside phosphorylase